jgi:hypothetical protein
MIHGVRVIRDGTAALIEHDCEPVIVVRLELGAHAGTLTDREIVERYSQRILALGATMVASPQLRWDEATRRWRPGGRAIRCVVEATVDEPTVLVDEVELTIADLSRMLANHGAQICLVFLDD